MRYVGIIIYEKGKLLHGTSGGSLSFILRISRHRIGAPVQLSKGGVYRYASSPDFEVLLFGYAADCSVPFQVDAALAAGD